MKKDVILHIACLEGNMYAGAEVAVLSLIEAQSKHSKLLLLNCADYCLETKSEDYKVVNYNEVNTFENLEEPFNKPDIIVFHSIYYYKYISIAKQAKKNGVPYIVIPHGGLQGYAQKSKRIKKVIGNILLFNRFLKNASAIQYLCLGEQLNSIKKNKEFIISGNGFKVTNIQKQYISDATQKSFEFIYIGRYDIYFKGLDLLMECICDIQEFMRDNNIKVTLYGKKNSDYDLLEKMIKVYKISDIVFLNESIYGKEKSLKLLEADAFIQTSRSEGQPLGIIEAISLGLPCVLTNGTNFAELVEDEGIGWSSSFSKKDLANIIKKAFFHRKMMPEMSRKAHNYAKENLSWEKVSKEALLSYKKIINEYNKEKKNDK